MENNNIAGDSSVQSSMRTATVGSGKARLLIGPHNHNKTWDRANFENDLSNTFIFTEESDTTHPLAQS